MMFRATACLALCAVAAQASEFHVLHAPATVAFDPSAGSLDSGSVAGVVASALGIQPPSQFEWAGLYAGNPFQRPTAAATIIVEGLDNVASEMSYPMELAGQDRAGNMRSVVSGFTKEGSPSIASIVSEKFGGESLSVSVSACGTAAKRASDRDLTSSEQHTVSATAGVYADQAVNGKAFAMAAFSAGFLGDATYDLAADAVTYSGVVFKGEDVKFFRELHAMVTVAEQLQGLAAKSPAVLTFNVVTYKHMLTRHAAGTAGRKAAHAAVSKAVALITAALSSGFNGQALVLAVAVDTVPDTRHAERGPVTHMEEWIMHYHKTTGRGRRGATKYGVALAEANKTAGANKNGNWSSINLTTYKPQCNDFTCSCYKAYIGVANNMLGLHCKVLNSDGVTYRNGTCPADGQCIDAAGASTACIKGDYQNIDKKVWLTKVDTQNKGKVGCLADTVAGVVQTCTITGQPDLKCSDICVSTATFCPCNNMTNAERFEYMQPPAIYPYKCKKCMAGLQCIDGSCYAAGSEGPILNIALWAGIPGIAAIVAIWYVLHNIGTPLYAAMPDADDMDSKKSS